MSDNKKRKRRHRNVGPELRALENRAHSKKGKALTPVSKLPSVTYEFTFSSIAESFSDETSQTDEFEEDVSGNVIGIKKVRSIESLDSMRTQKKISLRQRKERKESCGITLQGNIERFFNHPLLKKETSTIGDSLRVRFDDDMRHSSSSDNSGETERDKQAENHEEQREEESSSSADDSRKENKNKQTEKTVRGRGVFSRFKKERNRKNDVSARDLPNEEDLRSGKSDDILSIIRDSSTVKSLPFDFFSELDDTDSVISQFTPLNYSNDEAMRPGLRTLSACSSLKGDMPSNESFVKRAEDIVWKGDVMTCKENFEEALNCYSKAIELLNRTDLNDEHSYLTSTVEKWRETYNVYKSLADSENILSLGREQENRGRYARACQSYVVAYRMRRDALGEHHHSLSKPLNLLGSLLGKRRQYSNAFKFLSMARDLNTDDDNGGLDSAAVTIRNLGNLKEGMGKYDQALGMYLHSLQLHKRSWDIIGISSMENNERANLLEDVRVEVAHISSEEMQRTKGEEGVEVFVDSSIATYTIDFSQQKYSSNEDVEKTVEFSITLHSIGRIMARHFACYTIAMEAYRSSLSGMTAVLGKDHPNVAALIGNIANLHKEVGNYDLAASMYKEVLRIEQLIFGKSHPELAVTYHNIGCIEYGQAKYREALRTFQRAMRIQKKAYGLDSNLISLISKCTGRVCEKLNDQRQALLAYRIATEIDKVTCGKMHPEVGKTKLLTVMALRKLRRFVEAEKVCKEVLFLCKRNEFSKEHHLVIEARRNLADIKAEKLIKMRRRNGKKSRLQNESVTYKTTKRGVPAQSACWG